MLPVLKEPEHFHHRPLLEDFASFRRDQWLVALHRHRSPYPHQKVVTRMRAELGRKVLAELSDEFKSANLGKFVAVGLKSKQVLAIANSMNELGKQMQRANLGEPCYIARIGFTSVAHVQ